MYEKFFGMTATPFARGIPTENLFQNDEVNEIHERLLHIARFQEFGILVGDSGAGKTTALRRLYNALKSPDYTVLYIADSNLTPTFFYTSLLEQLGVDTHYYKKNARRVLHHEIMAMRAMDRKKLVVIVDEGQLLSNKMLEEIRFLLNFNMDSENPLALIISGQTELWERLKTQACRAIKDRIDVTCFLTAYDYSQVKAYIEKQLLYAGKQGPIFSEDAIKAIYTFSNGVPRKVNRVCKQSLIYAYQNRLQIVDDKMVKLVLDSEVC